MKKVIYTEEQVLQLKGLLNGMAISGIQNAKQIVVISQILESGIPAEIQKEEKKAGD